MNINQSNDAIWWISGMNIDGDGAPNCYSPDNKGLDYLANAGKPGNWYGIVTDSNGNPIIQGPNDPYPGFYVSPTALQDKSKNRTDPNRYVDSTKIRYISIPSNATKDFDVHLGDVALIHCRSTNQAAAAIVADIGPRYKYGEGSIALAKALGLPNSPKNGGTDHGITMIIFKQSNKGWPRTNEDVAQQVQDLLNATGGLDQYGLGSNLNT